MLLIFTVTVFRWIRWFTVTGCIVTQVVIGCTRTHFCAGSPLMRHLYDEVHLFCTNIWLALRMTLERAVSTSTSVSWAKMDSFIAPLFAAYSAYKMCFVSASSCTTQTIYLTMTCCRVGTQAMTTLARLFGMIQQWCRLIFRNRGKARHLSFETETRLLDFETEARHFTSLIRDCLKARQLSWGLLHCDSVIDLPSKQSKSR